MNLIKNSDKNKTTFRLCVFKMCSSVFSAENSVSLTCSAQRTSLLSKLPNFILINSFSGLLNAPSTLKAFYLSMATVSSFISILFYAGSFSENYLIKFLNRTNPNSL
jgi:hypothetical protein